MKRKQMYMEGSQVTLDDDDDGNDPDDYASF